jgi:2-keto-4-pentenoate hydratase/2-oxohepta-3-ene-1,7-dioic acid hydratase in catechol pathway
MTMYSFVRYEPEPGRARCGLSTPRGVVDLGEADSPISIPEGEAEKRAKSGAPLPLPPRLLAPLRPGKVLAVGRNYAKHAREMGNVAAEEPFFFLKAPSTAVGPGEAIVIPGDLEGEVHHEAELAVVIGRRGRRIPRERAMEWVFGYACANDVTARTLQRKLIEAKLPWFQGKNMDTFLAFGPGILPARFVPDPGALRIRCLVDGAVRQDAPASEMTNGIPALLAAASRWVTLEPGDLLLTGTPAGVGPLLPGQTVEVRIEGVGSLVNPVTLEG